jgi:hypothetical protein
MLDPAIRLNGKFKEAELTKARQLTALLPIENPRTEVVAPSVFTGKCLRSLTTKELAQVFEVPASLANWFVGHDNSLPFLHAAPASVLLYFGKRVRSAPVKSDSPDLTPKSSHSPEEPVSWLEEVNLRQEEKATRSDDAKIPVHFWDNKFWSEYPQLEQRRALFISTMSTDKLKAKYGSSEVDPLVILRHWVHCRWVRNIYVDLRMFSQKTYGSTWTNANTDPIFHQSARDALLRVGWSDFWEWLDGSSLLFWRWSRDHQSSAVLGYPSWVVGDLPRHRVPQRGEKTDEVKGMVRAKLHTVRTRRYVRPGRVESLTGYFSVPKGDSDIRLVYDASKSGLNSHLWSPSFHLPTVDALVRNMGAESWMGDLDLGEMFHNFPLDIHLQPYCGIDLGPYFPESTSWERWVRLMMGLRPSPYFSIKGFQLGLESVIGDRTDSNNVFHWSKVILNLPGDACYNPSQPRVWKLNPATGKMAAALLSYVDDLRAVGSSKLQCWQVLHCVASKLSYLGIQVAARKTRPPTTTPGPWAGAVAWASPLGVCVRSPKEKWIRAKTTITQLQQDLHSCQQDGSLTLALAPLESARGFLVHMQQVYPSINPYLKGLHLTIDSWRDNRDSEGWKAKPAQEYWEDQPHDWEHPQPIHDRPAYVQPVPRYAADLEALRCLVAPEEPPLRYVQQNKLVTAIYGFVDASASGFGSSFTAPQGTYYTYGVWGSDQAGNSSNYRELNNLVTSLEQRVTEGLLSGAEVFVFTDNFTAEAAFCKGNTSSKTLFDLVLRLRMLEMNGLVQLQVIHIAGTRMMTQGTDGLSRGNLTEGVMSGTPVLQFIPLHLSALVRQPALLPWI